MIWKCISKIFCWEKGLQFLILRNVNQQPLKNLGEIRQHGFANNNPTKKCHLSGLEDNFRGLYIIYEIQFYDNHNVTEPVLKIIVPLFIYKYLKG